MRHKKKTDWVKKGKEAYKEEVRGKEGTLAKITPSFKAYMVGLMAIQLISLCIYWDACQLAIILGTYKSYYTYVLSAQMIAFGLCLMLTVDKWMKEWKKQ